MTVVRTKDRILAPKDSGYRDVQVFVCTRDGHVGELRLRLRRIDEVADDEHAIYEVRRDLGILAITDNQPRTLEEEALDSALLRDLQARFRAALQAALP